MPRAASIAAAAHCPCAKRRTERHQRLDSKRGKPAPSSWADGIERFRVHRWEMARMSVLSAMSKRRCSQSCPSPYSRCVLTGVHVTFSLIDEHSLRYVTYQPPPQWCQRKVEMSPLVTGPLRRRRLMEHRPLRRFGLERRERSDRSPTGMVRRRFVGGPRLLLRLGHLHSPSNRLLVFHRHRLLAFAEQPHGHLAPVVQHPHRAVEGLAHRHRRAA